jgi:glycosyltransferase involved in cell wall biosynthesis
MDLDVLLPFHKIDNYFQQAIDSLSSTKGVSFNTILIDDRVDKSQEINTFVADLKSFDIVKTTGGTGYGNALKLGTSCITKDYIALFNSDDLIDPLRFKKQLKELSEVELCISKISRIKDNNSKSSSIMGEIGSKLYDPIFLLLGAYGADASWSMRTEWWKSNVFFDNQDYLDWRIALKSFKETTISYIPEPLYFYRKHEEQVTKNRSSVSNNDLENTHLLWNILGKSYGLPDFSFEIFCIFACPWRNTSNYTLIQIQEFLEQIDKNEFINNSSIAPYFKKLIKRRLILLTRSNSNVFDKYWLAKKGFSEAYPLLMDIIRS